MRTDLLPLTQHLRSIGVPVSTGEVLDTRAALRLVGDDRATTVLGCTLVKTLEHRRALASVADLFAGAAERDEAVAQRLRDLDEEQLHGFLLGVLAREDGHGLDAAAAEVVDRSVTIRPGAPVAGTVHALRAFRAARPDRLRGDLSALLGDGVDDPADPLRALRRRRHEAEVERRLDLLRHALERQVRARLVTDRGALSVARAVRATLPDDVDLLTGPSAEVDRLGTVLSTLASRLERRLAADDATTPSGRIDVRATLREAMATGGVPLTPRFEPRRPPRPDLVVLADISGSVAPFARLTLALTRALQRRFHGLRSFVFVDGVDEVTDVVGRCTNVVDVAEEIDARGLGVHLDARSDYGRALTSFWRTWGHQVGPRTVVLVLGDGRSNYRPAMEASLAALSRRAGRVYWLNPERRATWHDGDSLIATYAPHCTGVHECRTLRHLEEFVHRHVR
ncbi:VWA domain-containing protein [Nocardioides sp. YIM 152588]|uniref:VWA domain-containing protein n=1 Tax=Nocardioides sp. YIM 152588 TaxID=3158259 RepID=UPI0032E42701